MINRIVLIDKAAGPTSHDIVQVLRGVLGERRIGHAGTLDPFATGLLVCGVGPTTRLAPYVADFDKEYRGRVQLGTETDSLDRTGVVVGRRPVPADWPTRLPAVLAGLLGEISQLPPMTSAVRVGGRRLYELARAGLEVERSPRRVRIERLTARPLGTDALALAVRCSKGTYVRVLAAEIGRALGTCAHLTELRRTRIGHLQVEAAFPSAELATVRPEQLLAAASLSPAAALAPWPAVVLSPPAAAAVQHGVAPAAGGVARLERDLAPGERLRLLDDEGRLLALGESLGGLSAADRGGRQAAGGAPLCRLLRVLVSEGERS